MESERAVFRGCKPVVSAIVVAVELVLGRAQQVESWRRLWTEITVGHIVGHSTDIYDVIVEKRRVMTYVIGEPCVDVWTAPVSRSARSTASTRAAARSTSIPTSASTAAPASRSARSRRSSTRTTCRTKCAVHADNAPSSPSRCPAATHRWVARRRRQDRPLGVDTALVSDFPTVRHSGLSAPDRRGWAEAGSVSRSRQCAVAPTMRPVRRHARPPLWAGGGSHGGRPHQQGGGQTGQGGARRSAAARLGQRSRPTRGCPDHRGVRR